MDAPGTPEPGTPPPPAHALPTPSATSNDDASLNLPRPQTAAEPRSSSARSRPSGESTPPPLPPRPPRSNLSPPLQPPQQSRPSLGALPSRPTTSHSIAHSIAPTRPQLLSKATTQLSLATSHPWASELRSTSDEDSTSLCSYAPTIGGGDLGADNESMLGGSLLLSRRFVDSESQSLFPPDPWLQAAMACEFDDVDDMAADGSNQDAVLHQWRAKLKHFLILSSAGKPIYSRHGDDQLVTNYMGVVQTLISFYQSADDTLRGFTAGDVRFVVMSKGPLNLVAMTRLEESDAQLRAQLEALYMQILSTLTLPSLERMFAARANYDLRRPLQGTETLLSALADGFTRGSPSTLLSALECLKLRKSQRTLINNTLLKTRSENLLYGLIVASGKLVSVVRPKKHSLHPGDLHLIFNMLFEAGSVQAGGGENWIPLCLPGFNNTGYLYMYVSFLNLEHPTEPVAERARTSDGSGDEVAVLLISADKESFFEMRGMRDELVEALQRNGSTAAMQAAVAAGRARCTDMVPGSPLRHFLYKSRANVQFTMPSYAPYFDEVVERRRLLSLYHALHAQVHAKPSGLKMHHETSRSHVAVGWSTPVFEMYAVAASHVSRAALAQSANLVVQWVRREEERVFIIGGAVF